MLDIKLIKDNPEEIKKRLLTRGKDFSEEIDTLLALDTERRTLIADTESRRAKQNQISKEIPILKKEGKDTSLILAEMKELSDLVKVGTEKISALDEKIENILLCMPNTPNASVPVGKDDSENVEIRRWGTPKEFSFEPQAHWDIGKNLDILDPDTAAKVTGTRFHFYKGLGARLERAVINYYLDTHTKNGYTEVFPPYMVNRDSMRGTGQLPKFEEDAFKVENNGYFLVPTAEVPVTNMHRNEILDGDKLTIKYCAYSACFRAEAGSAGRDQRGLIRQHQFNKVELVKFAKPEESYDELESLTKDATGALEGLGLPYRVVCLSTGDMGFSSAKTYDVEVWMPSYNRYVEISSCSNFEDYQARRANIKFKESGDSKARLVHTLNGSGLAVGRTVAAILENYQNEDGTVTIPEALVPYMHCDKIEK